MGKLMNLEGLSIKEIDCLIIKRPGDIEVVLNNGYAATTAKSNGAINIYKDDFGMIRCEAMRFCVSIEKKSFTNFRQAFGWVSKWLCKIK